MKKSLIATGLALTFASSCVLAAQYPLIVNNVEIGDVDVTTFTFTNGALRLTTTGATLGVIDGDGGNPGGGDDNPGDGDDNPGGGDDNPGGGDDNPGGGDDNPGNGSNCVNSSTVTCTAPFNWKGGESNTPLTIPKGKTVVTPFTTSASPTYYGEVTFEAYTPVATDIWISTTPNGPKMSSSRCSNLNAAPMYEIRWSQNSSSAVRCRLTPNTTYYFNVRHSNSNQAASTTYRTRTFVGTP